MSRSVLWVTNNIPLSIIRSEHYIPPCTLVPKVYLSWLLYMHQKLGAAQFCAAEVIGEAELEVSVSRLWLLAPSHFYRAGHFCRDVSGWTSPDVTEIDWTSTIFLSSELLRRVSLTSQCVTIWTFDVCLIHLIKVTLPELISDENFMVGDRSGLLYDGAIKPFWFSSEVVN